MNKKKVLEHFLASLAMNSLSNFWMAGKTSEFQDGIKRNKNLFKCTTETPKEFVTFMGTFSVAGFQIS